MLFDTQSPGRRRMVQIIFGGLALLIGFGLVFFGIGAATSGGGLFDALSGNNSDTSIDSGAKKDAEAAQKALAANPKDADAARKLARANLLIATNSAFDANGNVNKDGQVLIIKADDAWTKYLALGPTTPDASTGIQFASFYASPGVSKYDKAARALEAVLVSRKATAGLYAQLAIYALASGSTDKYKEARARSLALAPNATRRAAIAKELDSIEKSITDQQKAQAKAQAAQGDSAGGSTPKLPTLPTLQ